jgi:hypothetical protein
MPLSYDFAALKPATKSKLSTVASSSQIAAAFTAIGTSLSKLRVSK